MEARINRILDRSRVLPKSFTGAGWLALIAGAAPLIYFVAAAQLAPAQTLLPIPAPAVPVPPQTPPSAQAPKGQVHSSDLPLTKDPADSQPTVSFSPVRRGTISMPLGAWGEYEVSYRITTVEGRSVMAGDRDLTGSQFETPIELKTGNYRLVVIFRGLANRKSVRREIEFEVK